MNNVVLSQRAASEVDMLRRGDIDAFKAQIADAQADVSNMIQAGKEDKAMKCFSDALLNLLDVLSYYVRLLNILGEKDKEA